MGYVDGQTVRALDTVTTTGDLAAAAVLAAIAVAVIVAVCVIIRRWRRNPFSYPYFERSIDVSRRRNVDFDLEVADWLHDDAHWLEVSEHAALVSSWERESRARAEGSVWRRHRLRQLGSVMDPARGYTFSLTRRQTRYRQRNYERHAYQVAVAGETRSMPLASVLRLRQQALGRGPVTDEFVRRERAKMTPALRKAVAERDNYTCQECGKHMPDGVGLQIDHIVPVSKGGRTEMGNLQVLCSKCNGRKSNR